ESSQISSLSRSRGKVSLRSGSFGVPHLIRRKYTAPTSPRKESMTQRLAYPQRNRRPEHQEKASTGMALRSRHTQFRGPPAPNRMTCESPHSPKSPLKSIEGDHSGTT